MTREELCINACKYAIGELARKGSMVFITEEKENDGRPQISWVEVVEWLNALEQEPRWIPMVRREPTEEEKAEHFAQNGEELGYMLENEMPLNGQEVLVSIGEMVSEDVFDEDFYNFENNDLENVDAWMPKPKAYSEVET